MRLRRLAAVLFVVTAGLFVIGINAEGDSEATEAEEAEEGEEGEEGEAGHDEEGEEGEPGHDEEGEEKVLGVDVESPATVALAVIVSIALGVGLWLSNRRWLALVATAVALAFAVFDIAEVVHQLDESDTGLAVLAGVIAFGHVAAALAVAWSARLEDAS